MAGLMRLLIVVSVLSLAACDDFGTHESAMKSEGAEVLQLAYVPSTSVSTSGITTNGDFHFGSGSTDEVWAVVVRCDHGKTFSVRGKQFYDRAKQGAHVTLDYVEVLDSKNNVVGFHTTNLR